MFDWQLVFSPPASYLLMGAVGGFLYVLRQHLKGYRVRAVEYGARPVFGAVVASVLTLALQLPNHFTSLFVGYFGIDVWDAISLRVAHWLPFASKHEPRGSSDPPPARLYWRRR